MFATHVAPSQVAAIVFEPQLGEGGFVPAPPEFVAGHPRICDREGIVLVADEVQTGFGRTGRMFAMEHYGVEPDLIIVAKSIAAGLPLSGVVGKAEIMDAPHTRRDRRHLHRQPGRARRRARRPRRLRRGGPRRARQHDRRHDPRRACSAGRSAGPRSATCAASARCSRSSSCTTRPRRSLPPSSRAAVIDAALERGLILLKAGHRRKLHPRALPARRSRTPVLDEALGAWEDALAAVLGA